MTRCLSLTALTLVFVLCAGIGATASFTNMPKTIADNKWYWFRGSYYDYNYTDSAAVCASYGLKHAFMDSTADFAEIFKLFCGLNA